MTDRARLLRLRSAWYRQLAVEEDRIRLRICASAVAALDDVLEALDEEN